MRLLARARGLVALLGFPLAALGADLDAPVPLPSLTPEHQAMLADFNRATGALRTLAAAPPSCETFSRFSASRAADRCTLRQLCAFVTGNAMSGELYRAGRSSLPNFALLAARRSLDACFRNRPIGLEYRDRAEEARRSLTASRWKALSDRLRSAGEELAFDRLLQASIDEVVEVGDPGLTATPPLLTGQGSREELEARIGRTLARSGATFSEESRKLLVDYLLARRQSAHREVSTLDLQKAFADRVPALAPLFDDPLIAGPRDEAGRRRVADAAREARAEFDRMRARIRAELEKRLEAVGADAATRSAAFARLERLDIALPDPDGVDLSCTRGPDIRYEDKGHLIRVCRETLALPPMTFRAALVNAIARSIGPCVSSVALVNDTRFSPPRIQLDAGDNSLSLGKRASEPWVPAVSYSRSPWAPVLACLARSESLSLRVEGDSESTALVAIAAERAERAGTPDAPRIREGLSRLRAYDRDHRACYATVDGKPQESAPTDAFAAWLTARVVAGTVPADATSAQRQDLWFEAVALPHALACPAYVKQVDDVRKRLEAEFGCAAGGGFFGGSAGTSDISAALGIAERGTARTWPERLLEDVWLSSSSFAQAVGCSATTPSSRSDSCD